MEPLTIFAASVGFIGIFHLLATAVNTLTKNRRAGATAPRSDWYCFFKMSDLVGEDLSANQKQDTRNHAYDDNIEQRRQRQTQRPRLHA